MAFFCLPLWNFSKRGGRVAEISFKNKNYYSLDRMKNEKNEYLNDNGNKNV